MAIGILSIVIGLALGGISLMGYTTMEGSKPHHHTDYAAVMPREL